MKPELKLGRRVIAWNDGDSREYKVEFISQDIHGENWVLEYGDDSPRCFDNVKPDLTAEPMNGDEVEVSDDKKRWLPPRLYVGKTKNGRHFTGGDFNHDVTSWNHVRFPQQSKRDRVKEAIRRWQESSTVPMYDDLADQILKITEEDS